MRSARLEERNRDRRPQPNKLERMFDNAALPWENAELHGSRLGVCMGNGEQLQGGGRDKSSR